MAVRSNADIYIDSIVKQLKCEPEQKKTVRKYLEAEIAGAIAKGEPLEKVVQRMGTPENAARKLEEDLAKKRICSEKEKTDEKRKQAKRKKQIILGAIFIFAVGLVLFVQWGRQKVTDIGKSKYFTDSQVEERAKEIVNLLGEDDCEAIVGYMNEKLREALPAEEIQEVKAQVADDWGEVVSTGNYYMTEVSQFGKHYAVVMTVVGYENVTVSYSITFDSDMMLAGLYMK